MSKSTDFTSSPRSDVLAKLRDFAIGSLFALVLLVPKLLQLRKNERLWTAFRTALGLFGAALVLSPLGLSKSFLLPVFGLVIFIVAVLLPAENSITTTDLKARELGALVVVNGGLFQPAGAPATAAQLFVGSEHVWVLGRDFQSLLTVAVREITSVRAEEYAGGWIVRIHFADRAAEFSYSGVFAEHFAQVTQNSVQSVLRTSLPVLPQGRAASA
jgi:hypothetical protein